MRIGEQIGEQIGDQIDFVEQNRFVEQIGEQIAVQGPFLVNKQQNLVVQTKNGDQIGYQFAVQNYEQRIGDQIGDQIGRRPPSVAKIPSWLPAIRWVSTRTSTMECSGRRRRCLACRDSAGHYDKRRLDTPLDVRALHGRVELDAGETL